MFFCLVVLVGYSWYWDKNGVGMLPKFKHQYKISVYIDITRMTKSTRGSFNTYKKEHELKSTFEN